MLSRFTLVIVSQLQETVQLILMMYQCADGLTIEYSHKMSTGSLKNSQQTQIYGATVHLMYVTN